MTDKICAALKKGRHLTLGSTKATTNITVMSSPVQALKAMTVFVGEHETSTPTSLKHLIT
jgi:hypothetical protein